jgi:multidrug efflux system membrane fusion protein
MRSLKPLILLLLLYFQAGFSVAQTQNFQVSTVQIEDQKAVLATVEPIHQFVARARIGGTITVLMIKEGDTVKAGDELGLVVDQKIALQMKALDERIQSQEAQRNQAQIDYDRISELIRRGSGTQAQLDQYKTALEVQERGLNALRNDKAVLMQQLNEGKIISPASGRVLTVPAVEGSVVMLGESIATLAEENYILRVQLPERHARFLRKGDTVLINDRSPDDEKIIIKKQGKIKIVYPEIQGGRVIADIDVPELGSYFVGERTLVYLNTGSRETIRVPASAVSVKAGLYYVTLASGSQIVIQPGEQVGDQIEVLTGLHAGDIIKVIKP